MRTAILRLLQFLGKSRSIVFLKEKIFWQKSLKWISEGIHFLERKVISYSSCSFVLQALGLALSLILIIVFASVTINIFPVARLLIGICLTQFKPLFCSCTPLKTLENLWLSHTFQEYTNESLA